MRRYWEWGPYSLQGQCARIWLVSVLCHAELNSPESLSQPELPCEGPGANGGRSSDHDHGVYDASTAATPRHYETRRGKQAQKATTEGNLQKLPQSHFLHSGCSRFVYVAFVLNVK